MRTPGHSATCGGRLCWQAAKARLKRTASMPSPHAVCKAIALIVVLSFVLSEALQTIPLLFP